MVSLALDLIRGWQTGSTFVYFRWKLSFRDRNCFSFNSLYIRRERYLPGIRIILSVALTCYWS